MTIDKVLSDRNSRIACPEDMKPGLPQVAVLKVETGFFAHNARNIAPDFLLAAEPFLQHFCPVLGPACLDGVPCLARLFEGGIVDQPLASGHFHWRGSFGVRRERRPSPLRGQSRFEPFPVRRLIRLWNGPDLRSGCGRVASAGRSLTAAVGALAWRLRPMQF